MVVVPVPLMVPLAQFNVPFTVRSPAPVRTLWDTVSASWPLKLTTLAPFRVTVARSMDRVCVPLAPPTVRLLALAVVPAGTVTV